MAALLVLSYFIVKPFIIALLSAFVLAYLIKPIYTKFSKTLNKSLAALISVILALAIIIVPILLIIRNLLQQVSQTLSVSALKLYITNFFTLPILQDVPINPENLATQTASAILSITKSAIIQIPSLIVVVFITVIGTYYILKNWETLSQSLENYLPFKDKKKVSREMGEVTKNIIFGYILIAIIEFLIASLGFKIFGVTNFLLLAVLIGILAFVPSFGPLLIWGPLALFHLISKNYATAIGVLITGIIISVGIDNMLAPKFVGSRTKIHPFIMLIGILGGISVFGLFGFIIGPLVLVYTIKIIEEAIKED